MTVPAQSSLPSPRLKRSLACPPRATGLPRSSIAACRPSLAGTAPDMGNTSTTRHGREPLRTLDELPHAQPRRTRLRPPLPDPRRSYELMRHTYILCFTLP